MEQTSHCRCKGKAIRQPIRGEISERIRYMQKGAMRIHFARMHTHSVASLLNPIFFEWQMQIQFIDSTFYHRRRNWDSKIIIFLEEKNLTLKIHFSVHIFLTSHYKPIFSHWHSYRTQSQTRMPSPYFFSYRSSATFSRRWLWIIKTQKGFLADAIELPQGQTSENEFLEASQICLSATCLTSIWKDTILIKVRMP